MEEPRTEELREPLIHEIESIYSDALAQIGSIGSSELEVPPPLDHTKFTLTLDSNNNEESKSDWLPSGYIPVEPLSPLKLSDLEPPQITITPVLGTNNAKAEIKEENIKNSLKEIISDLDKELDGGGTLPSLKHDILLKQVSRFVYKHGWYHLMSVFC